MGQKGFCLILRVFSGMLRSSCCFCCLYAMLLYSLHSSARSCCGFDERASRNSHSEGLDQTLYISFSYGYSNSTEYLRLIVISRVSKLSEIMLIC